ncbi:MAG: hypothetical protein HQ534_09985 [Armatimonadetes bacterium]|nr:hypothetical protein [Armatimonadota bacterium]
MKETEISKFEIEDFWIRVYLNPKSDYLDSAVNRAYRDLNRTLHGISKLPSEQNHILVKQIIKNSINKITTDKFESHVNFDNWHKQLCDKIIQSYKLELTFDFSFGQAQKWINMTLKYLFALGEKRINGICMNYEFFHVPIDNIIQDRLKIKYNIDRIDGAWSKISDYNIYLDYQKNLRIICPDFIPMDIEFRLFNEREK